MEKTPKNVIKLSLSVLCIFAVIFSAPFFYDSSSFFSSAFWAVIPNIIYGCIALYAMLHLGIKPNLGKRVGVQLLFGLGLGLGLSLLIIFLPPLFGFSLAGSPMEYSPALLIFHFFFQIFIIGVIEEFVFRVFLQDGFVSLFEKNKWAGVNIPAFLFGVMHLSGGNLFRLLFTFGFGLILGSLRHKVKFCGFFALALAHGVYDFALILARMFLV